MAVRRGGPWAPAPRADHWKITRAAASRSPAFLISQSATQRQRHSMPPHCQNESPRTRLCCCSALASMNKTNPDGSCRLRSRRARRRCVNWRARAWANRVGFRPISGQRDQIDRDRTAQWLWQGGESADFIDTSAHDITGQNVRSQTPKPGVGGSSPSTPASERLNS
jgi:hypothetical protein